MITYIVWISCIGTVKKTEIHLKTTKLINALIKTINLLFLGNNFWPRNVRQPIKGSKDLDFSLVSNENLDKKSIVLVSHPTPWRLGKSSVCTEKKFGFGFFVGDVISGLTSWKPNEHWTKI